MVSQRDEDIDSPFRRHNQQFCDHEINNFCEKNIERPCHKMKTVAAFYAVFSSLCFYINHRR